MAQYLVSEDQVKKALKIFGAYLRIKLWSLFL